MENRIRKTIKKIPDHHLQWLRVFLDYEPLDVHTFGEYAWLNRDNACEAINILIGEGYIEPSGSSSRGLKYYILNQTGLWTIKMQGSFN